MKLEENQQGDLANAWKGIRKLVHRQRPKEGINNLVTFPIDAPAKQSFLEYARTGKDKEQAFLTIAVPPDMDFMVGKIVHSLWRLLLSEGARKEKER